MNFIFYTFVPEKYRKMVVFPHCKINLGLFVTEKRADGFHNIETIFYPTTLCDILEIVKAEGNSKLTVTGIETGSAEDNLCTKAYKLLQRDFKIGPVHMHLHKHIPVGSGLGGGSSDAVYTLKALNELFDLQFTDAQYFKYARQLGSDCSFFVNRLPQLAFEKGDIFKPVNLALADYYLVIIVPDISVNTAQAYSKIKPLNSRETLHKIISLPIQEWRYELYNDFEFVIFKMYPEIAAIKDALYKQGAIYASMSGSGSSVYGIFEEMPVLEGFDNYYQWQEKCTI